MQLFGDWVAGFHPSQYFVARTGNYRGVRIGASFAAPQRVSSPPASSYIALLVCDWFLPFIQSITEVVNSVFNRSELLVTLGVVGGLKRFLQTVGKNPREAWGVLSLVYLLVMLCRETGIVLPVITVVVLWIITPGNWRLRLRSCLPVFWLLIPLAVYLGSTSLHALETPLTC